MQKNAKTTGSTSFLAFFFFLPDEGKVGIHANVEVVDTKAPRLVRDGKHGAVYGDTRRPSGGDADDLDRVQSRLDGEAVRASGLELVIAGRVGDLCGS